MKEKRANVKLHLYILFSRCIADQFFSPWRKLACLHYTISKGMKCVGTLNDFFFCSFFLNFWETCQLLVLLFRNAKIPYIFIAIGL